MRSRSWLVAVSVAFSIAVGFGASKEAAARRPAPPPVAPLATFDLTRPRPVLLAPGQVLTLRGEARTSFDGVAYDAAARYDDAGERLGGLVALEDTGLRLARRERGLVALEATGAHAPLCAALAIPAPCLVPRTVSLAHERLLTEAEFAKTLTGRLDLEVPPPPTPPSPAVSWLVQKAAAVLALLGLAALVIAWRRRRERPLVRVRAAAVEARRAIADEPGGPELRQQIDDLVGHAKTLATAQRIAGKRLAREKARNLDATGSFGVKAKAEIERLEREHERARVGIEEIVHALKVMTLRSVGAEGSLEETERALHRLDADLELQREADAEARAVLAKP